MLILLFNNKYSLQHPENSKENRRRKKRYFSDLHSNERLLTDLMSASYRFRKSLNFPINLVISIRETTKKTAAHKTKAMQTFEDRQAGLTVGDIYIL